MPCTSSRGWSALLAVLALTALAARADETATRSDPPASETTATGLERSRESVSSLVEMVLRRADALFSGSRSYDAPTGSYVMLGGKSKFQREEYGGTELTPITRAKIHLPKTEERLQLLIERDIEGTTTSDSQRDAEIESGQATADNNPYLALRALTAHRLKVQLSADAGVRMRSPVDPFARLRGMRTFTAGAWQIPVAETLLARASEPFSATTEIGLLRDLTADSALGFTTNATWRENLRGFDLSQTANLAWLISNRSLAALELAAYGTTQPSLQDTAYSVALRYRRKVLTDWLLLEVRPEMVYARNQDFRPQPSVVLALEVYFGANYLPTLK
jgi:hypothetical protein